jgi:hypothetical protein
MPEPVETPVAEEMLVKAPASAGSQNSRDHNTAGTRGLLMAARTLAESTTTAEAIGTPRDPSHVSRDAGNIRGRLS